jgi:DNA-binding transcriptional MerR regulator
MKKNFSMKKLYYSISEVSKITELEQYVLRYWETEFELLKPAKNLAGNRIYTNKDIKLILHIKKLLRNEKYTIEGAKKLLKNYTKKEEEAESSQYDSPESRSNMKMVTKGELSLFNEKKDESLNKELETVNENLKKDLNELRLFLKDLLDDIN